MPQAPRRCRGAAYLILFHALSARRLEGRLFCVGGTVLASREISRVFVMYEQQILNVAAKRLVYSEQHKKLSFRAITACRF